MNDSAVPHQSGATGQGSPEQQVEIAVGDVFLEHRRPAGYGRTGGGETEGAGAAGASC